MITCSNNPAARAPDRGVLPGATLVIGHSPRVTLPEQVGGFGLLRKRCHGDSCFSIYQEGHITQPEGVPSVSLAEKDGAA